MESSFVDPGAGAACQPASAPVVQAKLVDLDVRGRPVLDDKAQRVLTAWLSTKRKTTRRTYTQGLEDFGRFVGTESLVDVVSGLLKADPGEFIEVTDLYRAHLRDRGLSSATIKRLLLTLQSVGRKAFRMGMIDWEPRIDDLPTPRGVRDASGPEIEKLAAVLAHLDGLEGPFANRDRVIVGLIWEFLLRRGEVAELDIGHVDVDAGTVSVLRKGWDDRTEMVMTDRLRENLDVWVELRGSDPGPLLYSGRGRGLVHGQRLSGGGVRRIVLRRSLEAGVGVLNMNPHAWRHTGICTLLPKLQAAGISWHRACDLTGHRNPMSLAPYLDKLDDKQPEMSQWLGEAVDLSAKVRAPEPGQMDG